MFPLTFSGQRKSESSDDDITGSESSDDDSTGSDSALDNETERL